jgi:hypothetical protein
LAGAGSIVGKVKRLFGAWRSYRRRVRLRSVIRSTAPVEFVGSLVMSERTPNTQDQSAFA